MAMMMMMRIMRAMLMARLSMMLTKVLMVFMTMLMIYHETRMPRLMSMITLDESGKPGRLGGGSRAGRESCISPSSLDHPSRERRTGRRGVTRTGEWDEDDDDKDDDDIDDDDVEDDDDKDDDDLDDDDVEDDDDNDDDCRAVFGWPRATPLKPGSPCPAFSLPALLPDGHSTQDFSRESLEADYVVLLFLPEDGRLDTTELAAFRDQVQHRHNTRDLYWTCRPSR